MSFNYGSIENTLLIKVVEVDAFKAIWKITKDKVSVCKDCEYRYICQDCRCFLSNPSDILSKPKNCSYDPFSNCW